MKNDWVDFKTIKSKVSIVAVLDHYGIKLRTIGKELRGRCPIHKGQGSDTFHASTEKNAFQCFSCRAKGNILDFVAAMENCSVREAALKLQEWFDASAATAGEQSQDPEQNKKPELATERRAGENEKPNKPLEFTLKHIDSSHPYLSQRGISSDVAAEFGVGFFSGKGSMSGRIVIPIHNEEGKLVAYAGRAIDGTEPKYRLPTGFKKSQVLFNLDSVLKYSWSEDLQGLVVVVEGFFDCIKVWKAGFPCVALMGCSLSSEQEQLLCSHFSGVVLMLDGDEAGVAATDDCLLRLGRRLWVKGVVVPEGKQPDELQAAELAALLEGGSMI